MKVGSGVKAASFLTSAFDGGEWSVSSRAPFTPGKNPRHPVDKRLGGSQSQSWRRSEEKILYPVANRIPNPRSSSPKMAVFIISLLFCYNIRLIVNRAFNLFHRTPRLNFCIEITIKNMLRLNCCILGCDAGQSGIYLPKFRSNPLPPFSV
jgi:hypothetical protein